MEPGHPDLVSYKFIRQELQLSRIWIQEADPEPIVLEIEFAPAQPTLAQKLGALLKRTTAAPRSNLFLSHQPRKGWNHGADVDELIIQFRAKRHDDLKQQIYRWLATRVPREKFRKAGPAEQFTSSLTVELPVIDEYRLAAELLESAWRQDITSTPNTQFHIAHITCPA